MTDDSYPVTREIPTTLLLPPTYYIPEKSAIVSSFEDFTTNNSTLSSTNMAQKARKDRAKSNAAALNNLHIGTVIVNTLFFLSNLLFGRRASMLLYVGLSIPSFVCEYVLESSGRPRYDPETKALRNSGEDLSAEGLTGYMFDIIWVTWASVVLVILFGNWGWLLWSVVPAYGVYKGFGLLGAARGMAGMPQQPQGNAAAPPTAGNRKQRRAA